MDESMGKEIKRYSDVYSDERRNQGWWYFTTHGVQPGSVPKGVNILEVRDTPNGTYFRADAILNTSELEYYDIKERVPKEEESLNRKSGKRLTEAPNDEKESGDKAGVDPDKGSGDAEKEQKIKQKYLEFIKQLKSAKDYNSYLQLLRKICQDDNSRKILFWGIQKGIDGNGQNAIKGQVKVTALLPTQNEIGVNDSLAYPLEKDPSGIPKLFKSPVQVGPNPIVVFSDGARQYVLDGHHRWSQVYMFNPNATMKAIILKKGFASEPIGALKNLQLIIGAGTGDIPSSDANGINIYTAGEDQLKNWIAQRLKTSTGKRAIEMFNKTTKKKFDAEQMLEYFMKNILTLKKTTGTWAKKMPPRSEMPQTNKGPDGVAGTVGYADNVVTESKKLREDEDDWYYGKEEADKYKDLILDNLSGKTISKRRDLANDKGGIAYEAEKLGIGTFGLLRALEGGCYQGWVKEVDDSTYRVMPSSWGSWDDKVVLYGESIKESSGKVYVVKTLQDYPYNGWVELMDKVDENGEGEKHRFTDREKVRKYAQELADQGYINWQGYPTAKKKPMNTKINIRESLNKYDLRTDNKYDLRNLYDACIMTDKEKRIIAEMISKNTRASVLYEALMNKFEGKELKESKRLTESKHSIYVPKTYGKEPNATFNSVEEIDFSKPIDFMVIWGKDRSGEEDAVAGYRQPSGKYEVNYYYHEDGYGDTQEWLDTYKTAEEAARKLWAFSHGPIEVYYSLDESLKEEDERTADLDKGIKDEQETIELYDKMSKKKVFNVVEKDQIKEIRDDEKDHKRLLKKIKDGKLTKVEESLLKESEGVDWDDFD